MKKLIIILILIVAVIGAVIGLTFVLKSKPATPAVAPGLYEIGNEIASQEIVMADYIRYPGKEGETALDLLKDIAQVGYKQYDFGVFVESINGLKPDDKHFWKLYYNGQESQVGADKLGTKYGDVVEWRLEEIK